MSEESVFVSGERQLGVMLYLLVWLVLLVNGAIEKRPNLTFTDVINQALAQTAPSRTGE